MRLFSAIAVPDFVARDLALFRGGLPDARWVEPSDFHVTLAFFGGLGRSVADELAEALSEIRAAALTLRVTGLSVFGGDRPRAIVALVERAPALLALEAVHRGLFGRLGLDGDARRYTPHVTLARLHRVSAGEVAGWLTQQPVFRPLSWQAADFALFSSRTSRGGGPYVEEIRFTLVAT